MPRLLAALAALLPLAAPAADDPDGLAFFEARVRPVLVEHCYTCHSARAEELKGGLRLDTRDGSPAAAALDEQARRDWWSLLPIARPPVPMIPGDPPPRNPIDAFLRARLADAGLAPAPEADRRTLIRRLTFDLIGLPPTPEEIDAFLGDPSPAAYETLVDRLLASPHYGERWARHWMDAVHFAETHGHDQDRIREDAWPYRDYLIESFNRDTPYARFVAEQIAADALFPDEPRLTPALGLLGAGPWDESSLRDIREDSIDREIGRYLDRDDIVTTVMSTFASATVHCARCHDHKFDPIPQDDYYSLQAVFAGTERGTRTYDPDPDTARRRADLTARRRSLRGREPAALAALQDPALQSEAETWLSRLLESDAAWIVLTPQKAESAAGATLTIEPDGSILSGGGGPAADTYTITVPAGPAPITALRLEVLADPRLPKDGPGRADNGNLHLTEFGIDGARIVAARADFDQHGWPITAAIDDDPQTAWGIYPEVGRPHEAAFELARPIADPRGATLTARLKQTHPAGHLIGRFRLSATSSPLPVRARSLPRPLAALADIPPPLRTAGQRAELAAAYLAESLDRQIAALPPPSRVYAGTHDFLPDASHKPIPGLRPVHVLRRGDIHQKLAAARPGALSCLDPLPGRFDVSESEPESARRAALARWLADPSNPLTWRSIVNRAWHHHFGRGLVDTPNDFGRMGAAPTHPELLDRLAADFRDGGGSLKALHRRIVTSAAYRQSSRSDPRAAEIDADNRLLGRMNRTRLDAEQVRDAILAAGGRLDRAMGGPSVRQFALSPGVHVTPVVDYAAYDWDSPGSGRRAVYRFLFRTLPDPFLDSLDAADASQLTPARNVSLTPLQALALLNDPFMLRAARHFAARLESAHPADRPAQIRLAHLLAVGRPATADEVAAWSAHAGRHGLPDACRLLLNSNEFLFLD